jgi:tetratricopeptide (TPR) repeat protein
MIQIPEPAASSNEEIYERLISLIENNQEQLTLIVVACDDLKLRQRMIDRYEQEAKQSKIQSHRIVLGMEPSLRAGLAKLGLPNGEQVVVTVTGAEWLLRVKTRSIDAQSDLDKFFGYLQWTREGLREFRYPIVLWVTYPILREMSRRAPDFWSWRKAVLRFAAEEEVAEPIDPIIHRDPPTPLFSSQDDDFFPPPEEIRSEIYQLESNNPESANLAVLYKQLAEIYVKRILRDRSGVINLKNEQREAIDAFDQAISRYQKLNHRFGLASTLLDFGEFLLVLSRYDEAIAFYQKSLDIWSEINDLDGEASSFAKLGYVYELIGQYQLAIESYQQSLEINQKIGNLGGEASSLDNLGHVYEWIGQYQLAIEFYQQSLEIQHAIGNRNGEAISIEGLGIAYQKIGQYQRSIEFIQQSLELNREIGNRHGEAISLYNLAITLAKYEPRRFEALDKFQQARSIFTELNLDKMIENCDAAIHDFNQVIALI